MGDCINMDDYRPHITIHDQVGNRCWIVPASVMEGLASKRMAITDLEGYEDILPIILADWLDLLEAQP